MPKEHRNLLIRDQVQTILRAWKIDATVPVRGNFNLDLKFPKQHLNVGSIQKTKLKSTYNEPLYELKLWREEKS